MGVADAVAEQDKPIAVRRDHQDEAVSFRRTRNGARQGASSNEPI